MKICILGSPRSGTTALYTLLQDIMLDRFGSAIDFVYEPFLWEKNFFNGPYHDVKKHFLNRDAVSIEGIDQHLKLPLFIQNPKRYKKNDFLQTTLGGGKTSRHILAKFVRANGRFLLLNKICPECKFIFTLRNPLDVLNSSSIRFSFFGGEFHRDDFIRFIDEINSIYGTRYAPEKISPQIEKEVLHWFYMNKFALETFEKINNRPLIIVHEDLVSKRKESVKKICEFLHIPLEENYILFAEKEGGSKTSNINLSKADFERLKEYVYKYRDLLTENRIENSVDFEAILDRYENAPPEHPIRYVLPGKSPNAINDLLRKKEQELAQKKSEIDSLKRKIEEMKKDL